jgi:hypothetical protein
MQFSELSFDISGALPLQISVSSVFLFRFLRRFGTGSYPPAQNGLHRNILQTVSPKPANMPHSENASMA